MGNTLLINQECEKWYPKITDLNKANYADTFKSKPAIQIPSNVQQHHKRLYPHKDPALYDEVYQTCQ